MMLTAVAVCAAASLARSAPQAVYIVDTLFDSVDLLPGDGICQDANGQCSLRAAIMEANNNAGVVDIFFAVNGVHTLQLTGTDDFCVVGDLDINPVAPLTELNFHGNGAGVTSVSGASLFAPRDRVFHIPASAPAALMVRFSGMTIFFGNATGATGSNGGGILAESGLLQITGTIQVTDCHADLDGGAIWSSASITMPAAVTIDMHDNTAGDDGGGLYLASPASMNGSIQSERNVAGNRGGGVRFAPGTTALLIDAVLQFNEATQGGGMANSGDTTIGFFIGALNKATGGGNGGAIANQNSGHLKLLPDTFIIGNQADNGGGGINNQFGTTLEIDGGIFRDNAAINLGGAISNGGDATITHSEFSSNNCYGLAANSLGGGAVYNQNAAGIFRAINCTFSGNSAPFGLGGAICNDFSAQCEISATTFFANRAPVGESLYNGNTLGAAGIMNIIGSIIDSSPSLPGNNVVAAAPITSSGFNINNDGTGMLPAPGDQFGTIGMPINTMLSPLIFCGSRQAHFPLIGSPAIDRGFCADVSGQVIGDDQCLSLRPTDGDGNGFAECDVGAIETPALPPLCPTCPGDMDGDNFVDGSDIQLYINCIYASAPPMIPPGCNCMDMDGDGQFDPSIDYPLFINKVLGIGDPNPMCP